MSFKDRYCRAGDTLFNKLERLPDIEDVINWVLLGLFLICVSPVILPIMLYQWIREPKQEPPQ